MSEACRQWVGQVVGGEFALREYLGGSEHSAVFATEFGERQAVRAAIKFIQADPANEARQLSRWKRAAEICHPRLLRIFSMGRCRIENMDLLYLVMEYAGENLSQVLPERALRSDETREAIAPVLEALTYLHSQELIHGQLKPSNILACDDQLKLSSDTICDFGESMALSAEPSKYDPPEVSTSPADAPRDVWSLGITFVEALTQRLPAWEPAPSQSVTQRSEPAVPETLPPPFLEIARNCLRRDPRLRCSIADISARLSLAPAARSAFASVAPTPSVTVPGATPSILEAEAPTIPRPLESDPATALSPLDVSLATATPLPVSKQALQKQAVAKPLLRIQNIRPKKDAPRQSMYMYSRSFAHSRYFVPTVGVALALTLIVPILTRHRSLPSQDGTEAPVVGRADSAGPGHSKLERLGQSAAKPKGHSKGGANVAAIPAPKYATGAAGEPASTPRSTVENALEPANNKQRPSDARDTTKATEISAAAPASKSAPRVNPSVDASGRGQVLNQVLPEISSRARATIHGTVRVNVKLSVDGSGNITGADLAAPSPSKYFNDQALQAARKWDFAPAKAAGHNAASEWLLRFEITQNATHVTPTETTP